jgi:hypothetical protein
MKKFINVNGKIVEVETTTTRRPKPDNFKIIGLNGEITRTATQRIGSNYNNCLVALDSIGYCKGYNDNNNDFVVVEYLKKWDEIEKEILKKHKGEKILLAFNDEFNVYILQLNLSEMIKYKYLFQLNVKSGKCGVAFRHFARYNELYKSIAEKIHVIEMNNFIDIIEKALNINETCNFGNIIEYYLTRNENDINENRFRSKKHDTYINIVSKNGNIYKKPIEIKASLNIKCNIIKESKSNSITNNFIVLE